ncbi:hypothetical protein MIR68_007907 [Amoeboaphelidium protococcarum]|nr:hypothetical protein MIR68_007907 [Amoeboaphelidium protococcarum]
MSTGNSYQNSTHNTEDEEDGEFMDFELEWSEEQANRSRSSYAFYSDIFNLVIGSRPQNKRLPDAEDYYGKQAGGRSKLRASAQKISDSIKQSHDRVLLKLNRKETKQLTEKIAFVLGVSIIWICAFIVGKYPQHISLWYSLHSIVLLTIRWFTYKRQSLHYFCFDLCYFVNFLTLWWLYISPQSQVLYMAVFCLSQGPVLWAILAWRNSLVFHSLDKVTSLFIHIAPSITVYTLRWMDDNSVSSVSHESASFSNSSDIAHDISEHLTHGSNPLSQQQHMPFLASMIYSLLYYILWQTLYVIGIYIAKQDKVLNGARITSYSWLLDPSRNQKSKNLMYVLCTLPATSGSSTTAAPQSPSDDSRYVHFKQQALFIFWQFMYAILTLMPTCLFYSSFYLHSAFLIIVLTISIWNGACYYVDVFSRRGVAHSNHQSHNAAKEAHID